MKRILACMLIAVLLLTASCAASGAETYQKYRYTFFGCFDTVIIFTAYARDQGEFETYAKLVESEMMRYHRIFDKYNAYEGVNNLYAVNQGASEAPVPAEPELMDLLLSVRQWRQAYGGVLNPAMGAVLDLWHDAREDGTVLPDEAALQEAAQHMDYDQVILDEEAGTVYFEDPALSLDVGAVAKGYAAQLTSDTLRENGLDSFLLNAGGNVVCGGKPLDGRDFWVVGVEDLDGVSTRETLGATDLSVVTSGDYQRYYTVDGVRYHHLIDPETLYPAAHMHAVTILHPDSALGDFLSTTAFLLPYEESRALIESIPGAEAMWTLMDGSEEMTDGFRDKIARLLDYFSRYENEYGLLENLPGWVFVEWSDCSKFLTPVNIPTNMLYALALEAAADLYGDDSAKAKAEAIKNTIRALAFDGEFFEDNLVRENGKLVRAGNVTETCQYYAFFTGVANKADYPALFETVLTSFGPLRSADVYPNIPRSNAFIGNFLRLETLDRYGEEETILREFTPYFGRMSERTGTLWENNDPHASCCHGFASYICVLYAKIAFGYLGFDETDKTIILRENFRLSGSARFPVPGGFVSIEITNGTRAVSIPDGYELKIVK